MPNVPRPRRATRQTVAALVQSRPATSNQPGLGLIAALAAHLASQHQNAAMTPKLNVLGAQSDAFQSAQARAATQGVSGQLPQVGGL